jgi:acyl carrier protein
MTERQIIEGIRNVLREHLQIESPVTLETDLFQDLELDSLKQLTFVVELENQFQICFDQGDEEGLRTIGDVVALIYRRVAREPTTERHLNV